MIRFWKKLNDLFGWAVILVFSFVMIVGLWQVYDNYYIFDNALDKNILKYKPDPNSPEVQESSPITDEMVGWLTIDGTNIDYPIMQGKDNIRFLNTDPFGNYSLTGSIFLDSRCSPDFSDELSIVYGHHMDYGKMFGALDEFLNQKYISSHTSGTLMVGRNAEKVYDLRVFAALRVSSREKIVFDIKQDEIRQFIHDNANIIGSESDNRILTLSTCADAGSVSRIAVFCYIIEK